MSTDQYEEVQALLDRDDEGHKGVKFFQFRLIVDGLVRSVLQCEEVEATTFEVTESITSLLEVEGETHVGTYRNLAYFSIPSIFDPEVDESERLQAVEIDGYFLSVCFDIQIDKIQCTLVIKRSASEGTLIGNTTPAIRPPGNEFDGLVLRGHRRTTHFGLDHSFDRGPRIKIIGIGGCGNNTVNRMVEAGLKGFDLIAANTDLQALNRSNAPTKVQLGPALTRGLGAGSCAKIGRMAALESTEFLLEVLYGADLVIVTTGLGGGTGTGAAPVIASLARELDILTIGVVTRPFCSEGKKRTAQANMGLEELSRCVDSIITVPNSKLKDVRNGISIYDAFKFADDTVLQGIKCISELITTTGIINLDFADICSVLRGRGPTSLGLGEAEGADAALKAMNSALDSWLLRDNSIAGATHILVNFTCSESTPMSDLEEAIEVMIAQSGSDADVIFGTTFVNREEYVHVMFLAAGSSSNDQTRSIRIDRGEGQPRSQYQITPKGSPINVNGLPFILGEDEGRMPRSDGAPKLNLLSREDKATSFL
ncbi:MAG: cell division protein FtsZ [Acidobacteria bacterium]|nr:cell division protein FtsZ [Acidobacteriota bacterium]